MSLGEYFLYIDESGDLGFSSKSTRYVVVAGMLIPSSNVRCVSRIPKKIRTKILKRSKRKIPEIKANSSNERVKRKVLEYLSKCANSNGITVFFVWIDKKNTYQYIKSSGDNKSYHYNFMIAQIPRVFRKHFLSHHIKKLTIIIDDYPVKKRKGVGTTRKEEFQRHLKSAFIHYCGLNVNIIQRSSAGIPELQVTDFVSHAYFQYLERGNAEYYDILRCSGIEIEVKQIY